MRNRHIIYLLICLLLFSCAPEQVPDGDCIDFSEVMNNAVTKAGGVGVQKIDQDAEFKAESFGIYGYRSANGNDFNNMVFDSEEAKKVSWSTDAWTYSPKAKWIRSNYYRFRAFWPYDGCIAYDALSPSSNANMLAIEYSTLVDHFDLMVAYATRYPITGGVGTVDMTFNHALAGVCFKVKFEEDVITEDFVTEFYLQSLYPTGTLLYGFDDSDPDPEKDAEDIKWFVADAAFDMDSKLYHWIDDGSQNRIFTGTSTAIIYDNKNDGLIYDGLIFVIPQTVTSATTLNFKTNSGGSALHTARLTESESITWEPGKIYTYTITIKGAGISLSVDIADWNVVDSNIDVNL